MDKMESREQFALDMIKRREAEIKKVEEQVIDRMHMIMTRYAQGGNWSTFDVGLLVQSIGKRDALKKEYDGMSQVFDFMAGE